MSIQLYPDDLTLTSYDCLVLSSGGTFGLYQLGILHYLYENQCLKSLRKFIGTSIGSVIGLLLSLNFAPIDILAFIISRKTHFESTEGFSLKNLITDFGFKDPSFFFDEVENLILSKIEYIPSLLELKEDFQREFYSTTYNLTMSKTEYLSFSTYPDMSCMDAIKMSCNIPLIFPKIIYNNCYYLDGAVCNHFPIKFAEKISDKIIGIAINCKHTPLYPTESFTKYIQEIIKLPMKNFFELEDYSSSSHVIIFQTESQLNIVLKLENEMIYNFFSTGYIEMKNRFMKEGLKEKQD